MRAAVAATDSWTDPDGFRMPAGEVHAWLPSTNPLGRWSVVHPFPSDHRRSGRFTSPPSNAW